MDKKPVSMGLEDQLEYCRDLFEGEIVLGVDFYRLQGLGLILVNKLKFLAHDEVAGQH